MGVGVSLLLLCAVEDILGGGVRRFDMMLILILDVVIIPQGCSFIRPLIVTGIELYASIESFWFFDDCLLLKYLLLWVLIIP